MFFWNLYLQLNLSPVLRIRKYLLRIHRIRDTANRNTVWRFELLDPDPDLGVKKEQLHLKILLFL